MSFGYIGDTSTSVKQKVKNKGILTTQESFDLERQGFLGGSLELIEEQNYSSTVTAIDFNSIKGNMYDLHLLQVQNFKSVSSNNAPVGIQFFESGTIESASVYRYGLYKNSTSSATVDTSTSSSIIKTCTTATGGGAGKPYNFYAYLYKLNDSSASSFVTSHGFGHDAFAGAGTVMNTHFGGGMLPQQSTVDGIRITTSTSVDLGSFNIKLYGIKQ